MNLLPNIFVNPLPKEKLIRFIISCYIFLLSIVEILLKITSFCMTPRVKQKDKRVGMLKMWKCSAPLFSVSIDLLRSDAVSVQFYIINRCNVLIIKS